MSMRSMSNTFDKLSFLDSFIEEVNSYLPGIETNLERLVQSPGDMDALEETYRLTHTIGGSASMMDFPGLAHVAHGMEDILGDALDGLLSLDDLAFGLLRRSLGRLHRLLEGIRNNIDEDAIIAEDDDDYTRYRTMLEAATASPTTPQQPVEASSGFNSPQSATAFSSLDPFAQPFSASPPKSPALPSFDEVLASFRTPPMSSGDDLAWPEEPAQPSHFNEPAAAVPLSPASPEPYVPTSAEQASSSALDALVASTRRHPVPPIAPQPPPLSTVPPASLASVPPTPVLPTPPAAAVPASAAPMAVPTPEVQPQDLVFPLSSSASAVSHRPASEPVLSQENHFPQAYGAMQQDAHTLESQAASLKGLLEQLRSAINVVDEQRSEFKGFLDGSKDALDRMELWAGEAMGLNLRNSPEQVRRYLPLSVMWVSNTRLKKVLDLLRQVTGGVEFTEEQLSIAFQQLHNSIRECGEAFHEIQMQAPSLSPQTSGWG